MPVFFEGAPGRVAVLEDPGLPGRSRLLNIRPEINFQEHRSIITQVGFSGTGNYQLMHAVGNTIHVYVFGDRVGNIVISGISFAGDCEGGDGPHGIEQMLKFYRQNRLAKRKDEMEVIIGRTPLRGLLTDINTSVADTEKRLFRFDYVLKCFPEDDDD